MKTLLFVSMMFFAASSGFGAITGQDLLSGKKIDVAPGTKGTVLVFLSARCPCSNSHIALLKSLAKDYKDFSFVAVHSNADEPSDEAKTYFKGSELPFPVIQDEGTKIADGYKALKTPHAFLLSPDGKILYKGGVTNSNRADRADVQFLRDALADVEAGQPVKVAEGRALGCNISRGEKNVW